MCGFIRVTELLSVLYVLHFIQPGARSWPTVPLLWLVSWPQPRPLIGWPDPEHILDTARNINQHTSSFNPAGHLLHPSYIRLTTSSTQFSEFLDIKDQVIQIFDIWQQVGTQINFDVLLLIAPEPLTRKSSISFSQSIKFLVKQTSTFIRFYIVYVRSCIKTSCELLWH